MASTKQMQERAKQRKLRLKMEQAAAELKSKYEFDDELYVTGFTPGADFGKYANHPETTHVCITGETDFITFLIPPGAPVVKLDKEYVVQRLGYLLDNNRADDPKNREEIMRIARAVRHFLPEFQRRNEIRGVCTAHLTSHKMIDNTYGLTGIAFTEGPCELVSRTQAQMALLEIMKPLRKFLHPQSVFCIPIDYMTPGACEHEVSAHMRTLKSGKQVPVRAHVRNKV